MQRFVYSMAKSHHQEEQRKDFDDPADDVRSATKKW